MRSNFFRPALILRWPPGAIFSGRLCQIAGRQVISTLSSQPLALLTARNSLASAPQAMNRVLGPSAIPSIRRPARTPPSRVKSLSAAGSPGCYCRDWGSPESDRAIVADRLYVVVPDRRSSCGALLIQLLQRVIDPLHGQLLMDRVLAQALAQRAEIDLVQLLVLVEAGEHHGFRARDRILVRLQALRADLLHHALHRRVDGADRAMRCLEERL